MNLKKNILLFIMILSLILIEFSTIFLMYKSLNSKNIKNEPVKSYETKKNMFAMMLEQPDGTYKESNMNKWPSEGYVYSKTKSGCVDINGNKLDGILVYDEDTNIAIIKTTTTSYCYLYFDIYTSICTYDTSSTVAEGLEGAKYNCKVDPNKPEYTFYLLDNNTDGTSDLIMNANINASGEAVIPGVTKDTGEVEWYADDYNNINGPVTAMTYLHNATKNWTNVNPLNYEYYDREVQGVDINNPVDESGTLVGYESFISTNGVATITKGDSSKTKVTIGTAQEPLRTRMPIYSSDESITEVSDKTAANAYLYDNLDSNFEYNGPYGYMTLTSYADGPGYPGYPASVQVVYYDGVDSSLVVNGNGVRPVITVKL